MSSWHFNQVHAAVTLIVFERIIIEQFQVMQYGQMVLW